MHKNIFFSIFLLLMGQGFSTNAEEIFTKVAEFDAQNPPGNIGVSSTGRLFMSTHHFYGAKYKIVEVFDSGEVKPYPNAEFSESLNPVLGVVVDSENVLWILETADEKTNTGTLIGWDIETNSLFKRIPLKSPVIPKNSFLNDLAVDRVHDAVYITDTAGQNNSALIVVDLKTERARRLLEGSPYTLSENINIVIDEKVVNLGSGPARIGVNPIVVDSQNEWLYFGAMNGTAIYRIKTSDLLNYSLDSNALSKRVDFYGEKPISDGITVDNAGNVYVTSITDNSIGFIDSSGKYSTLFKSESISWPDGFAVGPKNEIFFTVNELHHSSVLNDGNNATTGKFAIYKFTALASTDAGR